MWHTSIGDRILQGTERNFYLTIAALSVNELKRTGDLDEVNKINSVAKTYDCIFDSATFGQKILLMRGAVSALVDPDVAAPTLTNTLEAAAYFPFAMLNEAIAYEIDAENNTKSSNDSKNKYPYYWRKRLWTVFEKYCQVNMEKDYEEMNKEDDDADNFDYRTYLNPHSLDIEVFIPVIDNLANRIFWNRDWQLSSIVSQLSGGIETPQNKIANYYGYGYFTTHLPETTKPDIEAAVRYINNLPKMV